MTDSASGRRFSSSFARAEQSNRSWLLDPVSTGSWHLFLSSRNLAAAGAPPSYLLHPSGCSLSERSRLLLSGGSSSSAGSLRCQSAPLICCLDWMAVLERYCPRSGPRANLSRPPYWLGTVFSGHSSAAVLDLISRLQSVTTGLLHQSSSELSAVTQEELCGERPASRCLPPLSSAAGLSCQF